MEQYSERMEKALIRMSYWVGKYRLIRDRLIESNNEDHIRVLEGCKFSNLIHILTACNSVKEIYEEERGEKVEQIGNLQPLSEIEKKLKEGKIHPHL